MLMLSLFTLASVYDCEAKPKFVFGTYSRPDVTGEGCDGDRGTCIIIHGRMVDDDFNVKDLGDGMGLAEIEVVDGQLKFNILFDTSKDPFQRNFNVIKDIRLDKEVCEYLGYQTVIIEAGEYGVDFSRFEYGSVLLNVQLR